MSTQEELRAEAERLRAVLQQKRKELALLEAEWILANRAANAVGAFETFQNTLSTFAKADGPYKGDT